MHAWAAVIGTLFTFVVEHGPPDTDAYFAKNITTLNMR